MGRPLNKRNFGDIANAGNQIRVVANIDGLPEEAFIVEQKSKNEYICESTGDGDQNRCRLVFNINPVQGECYIQVFPNGSDADGSGAAATAALEVVSVVIVSGGTGYTAADTLTIDALGGTGTQATLTADSVTGGVIDGISIATGGDYSVIPGLTAVSVTGGTGGNDATFDITFSVLSPLTIGAGGTLYDQIPTVNLRGGGGTGAVATAAIAAGAVTAVTVAGGDNYITVPTVEFANAGITFARSLLEHKVKTQDTAGNAQWNWDFTQTPGAGEAKVDFS